MRFKNNKQLTILAYGLDKESDQKILVFDLGGGTFDVSILEIEMVYLKSLQPTVITVWAAMTLTRIIDWLADGFKRENGIDLRNDKMVMQRLRGCRKG